MTGSTLSERLLQLTRTRVERPDAVIEAARRRARPGGLLGPTGRLMVIAADHAARGTLRAGDSRTAMADRAEMLGRLVVALDRPGVNGFLGTPDLVEDLLLLGALDHKVVLGSMNRGGLAGTTFELDDRFTAYDPRAVERMGLQGGKMLLRIDPHDPASAPTMQACAQAVSELAERRLLAVVEPFIAHRRGGRVHNDLTPEAVIRSITVASGLGTTSAYTWLKLPVVEDMERVLSASTLPALLLGGEVGSDQELTFRRWKEALAAPTVQGLVAGRSLLYPHDGDVANAVDTAVGLL